MKNEYIVSPLYDFAFAEIFGSQKNIDITIGFLKTLLDIPQDEYDRLTVVSPILRRLFHKYNRSFTKTLKLVILELPKLPDVDDSSAWRWLRFLKCKEKEEFEMLAKKYPDMEKPVYCAKKMSLFEYWRDIRFHQNLWKVDERMRELYLQTEFKDECIAEGLAKGKAQGQTEEKLETARKALKEGLSVDTVQRITGLDLDIIKNLES